MRAVICGPDGTPQLIHKEIPKLQHARDALVRVTLSTICTSDLHILHGAVPRAKPGTVLGHEFVGEVVETGPEVRGFCPGDRVAANCITFCGECWFCRHGFINNCRKGGWELGCRIDGCQADFVRVPFADTGLTKIPPGVTEENALFMGDILSSGYFGAQLCEIRPGDTVAVIGCGPVGLCALECAGLFGAARRIALDIDESRLDIARARGLAEAAFHPGKEDVESRINALTSGRGADAVIEAAGGEDTFTLAWTIARPNAVVALVAMYEQEQRLPLPRMYGKNLIFKTGGVDAVHGERLMRLLEEKKLHTDYLITHTCTLDQIVEGYRVFEEKQGHCLKMAVTP